MKWPKEKSTKRQTWSTELNEKGQKDKQLSTKTLQRKLKIDQHEHHIKPYVNSGVHNCRGLRKQLLS
jgi:hypothetical protein